MIITLYMVTEGDWLSVVTYVAFLFHMNVCFISGLCEGQSREFLYFFRNVEFIGLCKKSTEHQQVFYDVIEINTH